MFCYSIIPRLKRWDSEVEPDPNRIPDWSIDQLEALTRRQPFANGRVTIGLGFDMLDLSRDQVVDLYQKARNLGVKSITSHWRKNTIAGTSSPTEMSSVPIRLITNVGSGDSVPSILHNYSLLGPDVLLSHATGSSETDFALLRSSGAFISGTPATESQMAHGEVVCFRDDVNASLGADCHSANSASMLHAMHIGLAVARSHRNERVLDSHKFPRQVEPRTLKAFNLATICGARAVGMEKEIGSLEVGKSADIVVFATDTPAMACAVDEDPLVAIVRHAGTREVEIVLVDGVVRKAKGSLPDVDLEQELGDWEGRKAVEGCSVDGGKLQWAEIMRQLLRSRGEIERRIDECDVEKAKDITLERWGASKGDDVFA